MCGISGFVDFKKISSREILHSMNSMLTHRGPDDFGEEFLTNTFANVGLGHTRLSILDLSSAGHQPMNFKNYKIIFNGEIYNFKEIRNELLSIGHQFSSESDTEVILHAYAQWEYKCLDKFIGMFAFVIFDIESNLIFIARDRAGVKPIYYSWHDSVFLFASELKSLTKHPRYLKHIDIEAVNQFFDFGYIPSPYCIFKNTWKLKPGNYLILELKTQKISLNNFWNVNKFYELPRLDISYVEAKKKLHELLISSYEYRMVSDVPVGIFLSGGYDSTSVAAILQSKRTSNKLKTFTIGFEEGGNEAQFAKSIAKYIGTDHNEIYCSTKEAQNIIPNLSFFFDEPFADSSAIPTILVSQFAKKQVTVSLSADGGDETFAGYSIYDTLNKHTLNINKIPIHTKQLLGNILNFSSEIFPLKYDNLYKLKTLEETFKVTPNEVSRILFKYYHTGNTFVKNRILNKPILNLNSDHDIDNSKFCDILSRALSIDYKMYMCDDILTKVDRATMSVGLEGREPLLDHRIIEFVAQLPLEYKFGDTKKRILKEIVHEYVPFELMNRPKTGFSIPLKSWLNGDLKFMIFEFLNENTLNKSGLFNVKSIIKIRDDFFQGKFKDTTLIWKIMQFQMWYNYWL